MTKYTCSLCEIEFDPEDEGGVSGDLGIVPVSFCVWCHAGLHDLYEQRRLPVMCPKCGWCEGEDDDDQ